MLLSWIVALIGLYLMVRSPRPVAVGMFVLPLVLGLVIGAGWFAPRESDWLDWGGTVAFWGTVHGIFLLAGGGLHLRGVLRRADVPGADAAAQGQAAVPHPGWRCRASSSPSGSTGGRSRSPSRC